MASPFKRTKMRLTTKCSFVSFCVLLILLYDTDKTQASGPPTCNLGCKEAGGNVLKLEEGVTYTYSLDGNTETLIPKAKGPHGDSVRVGIKAKVEVSALPQCQAVVKLRNVHVSGPDAKKYGSLEKLEQFPLVVSLHGGKLDAEVCADPQDDFTSLNIKRAVASLLQANTGENGGSSEEIDVFGGCRTNFRVSKDKEFTVVKKRRDLNNCRYREGLRQDFFASSHGHSTKFQAIPLLDSYYDVEQRIKNGILEVATAKESYLFKPFANRDKGAKTNVYTKLILESTANIPPIAHANSQPRSIIFENPHEVVTSNTQAVMAALHKLDDSLQDSVPSTAGKDFGTLVKLVRHSSKEDLLNIYGNAKAGAGFKRRDVVRKIFTDALFRARSADSVAVAIELLRDHEIDGQMAKLWYLSFAFARHISASTLAAATALIGEQDLPYEAYYGIGAMAGQYCREHVCEKVPEFEKLLSKLSKLIINTSKSNKEKENMVIAALKGLKNVKHLTDEAANKVASIIKDPSLQTRVRVAALETAQSDACRGKLQRAANELFTNREEDSELRIKAYLVIVGCPTPKAAAKLAEFIETEPVNQVGTFITSHLRNLRAGSNPDKELAREIFYNVKPKKKFPIDYRKFSHNYDFSYNLDAISTSAAVESNVIFSQKSYLPRSINLNLTTEVFGHAFNIFELSGRAENLESIVEKYFGPRGYFKTHNVEEIFKEGKHEYQTLMNHIQEKYKSMVRHRRSVSIDQTNNFASKVKLFNSEFDNTLDVDLSLKVLGNELWWLNIDERDEPQTASTVLEKLSSMYDREVKNVKEFSHDIKEHFQILDSELSYPTATGFPLRLRAVGSGVFHMKLAGKLDVSAFMKDPKNGEAHLEIIPSSSIDIHGEMTIDGYAVEAGVKLAGNLHTATGSDIDFKILNGHGFDLNFKLPVKNSDVLTATTEVLTTVKERGQAEIDHLLEFQVPRSDYSGCFDQLNQFVGVIFCGDIGFPMDKKPLISNAALYPLNGHSKVSLRFAKEDESLQSYQLRAYFNVDDPHSKSLEIKFDTPGSKTPREISFKASAVTHPNKAINIQLISPIQRFSIRGEMIDSDTEHSLSGSFIMNDAMEYRGRVGLLIEGSTYKPILEYTRVGNNALNIQVDGTVNVDKKPESDYRKYTFNNVRFMVENKGTFSIDGSIIKDINLIGSDLRVGYESHIVDLKTKFQNVDTENYKMLIEINPSQYPKLAFSLKYDYRKSNNLLENNFVLIHGPDLNSKENKLSIFQQIHYDVVFFTNFDISTKNSISYPAVNLEGHLEGALNEKNLNYNFIVGYDKHKFKSKLNAKTGISQVGDYEIDFYASAFDREIKVDAKREIVDANKSKFFNKLEISPGRKYEVSADVIHQFAPNDIQFVADAVARIHNLPNEYRLDIGVRSNPSIFNGHSKMAVGPDEILNGELQFTKSAEPTGNFRLTLLKVLDSHGEYHLVQGRGTGSLIITMPELNRKVKGTADLTHNGPHHTGVIDIFYDFERDNSRKLHIETNTQFTRTLVDSRNNIDLDGKHLQVNFNGDIQGKFTNGGVNAGYDLTLPNGEHFVGKLKESMQLLPQSGQVELLFEIARAEKQGAPLSKIFLNAFAKSVDLRSYSGQFKFEAGKECPEGTILYSNTLSSIPQDGKWVIDHDSSVTGSEVKYPFNSKTHAVVSRSEIVGDSVTTFGEYSVKSNAKILTGIEDGIRHLEYNADITTGLDVAQRLKLQHLFYFAPGHAEKPHLLKLRQHILIDEKSYEFKTEADVHSKYGLIKTRVLLPSYAKPSTAQLEYKHVLNDDIYRADITFIGNFDQDKDVTLKLLSEYDKDFEFIMSHLTGHLPIEVLNTIDIKVDTKKIAPLARNTDIKLLVNDEKMEGIVKYDFTPDHPLIDISLTQAAGQSRLYYKLDKIGERQATLEGLVAWVRNGGGQFEFSSKIDLESIDNCHIFAKVNSEKLGINNFKLELVNKPGKSGNAKKITFIAQNSDKMGISASVSYKLKENESGFVIEGKGNIEIDNEKLPLTYKATYKRLSDSPDKEVGKSFVLNANFNKGTFVYENKLTDKEFHYNSKYCKQSNCAHYEALFKMELTDALEFTRDFALTYENTIDGKNDNFKLFSRINRRGFLFDHETGLTNKERTYQIKSYLHENEGAFIITLPMREIVAIANYEIPILTKIKSENKNGLQFRFDGNLYMDKIRNPGERANLFIFGDFTTSSKSVSATGEIKFSHPKLHKDMFVKTRGSLGLEKRFVDASIEVDVFNRKNQKISALLFLDHDRTPNGHNITGVIEFASKGLHMDVGASGHTYAGREGFSVGSSIYYTDKQNARKEAGVFIEGTKTRFFTIVKLPNKELFKVDSQMQISRNHQITETDISVAELTSYIAKIEVQDWKELKATIHSKDNPGNHIAGNFILKPTHLLLKADHYEGQNQNELFIVNFELSGAQDSSQPRIDFNSENIQQTLNKIKAEKDRLISSTKPYVEEAIREIHQDLKDSVEGFKKAQPDYKPLIQAYKKEFDVIAEELNEDPEFKELAEVIQRLIRGIMKIIQQQTNKFITLNEKLSQEFNELREKVIQTYQKALPAAMDAFEKIFNSWTQVANEILNYFFKLLSHGLHAMKEAEPEIRKLAESFGIYFRDLMKAVVEVCESLKHEVEEWIERATKEFKDLPIFAIIDEQIKEIMNFELPPQFWTIYEEVVFALEDVVPTVELKNLFKSFFSYIEKKLKRVEVNDAEALKDIVDKAVEAFKSIVGDIREQYIAGKPVGIIDFRLPFTWPTALFNLPEFGSFKDSSFLRYMKSISELPSLSEIFYTYRPTLHPLDYIPPYDVYAVFIHSHFFTFNGKHVAFEGSCSYILAQDFLDGNFSIVANLENGKLKSITIIDKINTVEMFNDNTVSVNGKHGDYPFELDSMSGRLQYGSVHLKHKAGVKVWKVLKRDVYIFKVSGFYFWRTRGILGNINNEKYFEFTLPNGHIAKDTAEFINAYKVVDSCPNVPSLNPSESHAPECDKFFTSTSSLKAGFNFVDPQIFREACDQHVAISPQKLEAACEIVGTYVVALKKADYLFASIPPECVKCTIGDNLVEYGHTVPVKSPVGKADVIFVVEQSSLNSQIFHELVKPLMGVLTNDLASKGLGDVEYGVIGYGGVKQDSPNLYGNDGKLTFNGKHDNMIFGDAEKLKPPYDTLKKKIKYIYHYFNVELGNQQIVTAMNTANNYPFRQGSAKIIILVNTSPCEKSATYPISLQILRIFSIRNYYKEHGLNFHIISPLSTLTVSNNPNDRLKNIVGFDNEHIYTLDGSKPDRKDLMHFNDLCISFSQSSGGAAFSSQNFVESSPEMKSRFIDVVSKRISQGAVEYDYIEDCTCNLYHGILPFTDCKVTSQTKRP